VKRASSHASGERAIRCPRLIDRGFCGERDDGVDRRIDSIDSPQERLDDLDNRHRALPDQPRDLHRSV
jgi:hypothetical protein